MQRCSKPAFFWSLIQLVLLIGLRKSHGEVQSATFLSPMFTLGPGSVVNNYYYDIEFPKGHVAIKSFNGEVVDEKENSVPLHETYIHHWLAISYHQLKESDESNGLYLVKNSGICQNDVLRQYFGHGSETRKTPTYVPDPYGIEVGNQYDIPNGYEERWLLNVHAIDTRGVEDRLGCTECRCDLYNVTTDEYGEPLGPHYEGGLRCCYHHTQCMVNLQAQEPSRNLYFRYTVKWVDWNPDVIPVKIYNFDVTDTWKRSSGSVGLSSLHGCQIEYDVQSCGANVEQKSRCIDSRRIDVSIPHSGYFVYGVAHQHAGGTGVTLSREDGSVICSSMPTYGRGEEAGNESGYIVGMSTCSPKPDTVFITREENLILESNYNTATKHTGVMGVFHIMIAEKIIY